LNTPPIKVSYSSRVDSIARIGLNYKFTEVRAYLISAALPPGGMAF
jgi:hypothetical protein